MPRFCRTVAGRSIRFEGAGAAALAGAAAAALAGDGHEGAIYDLTGPVAFTLPEAAEAITRLTGRAVSFHDETLEEAYASRADHGAPTWQVEAWVSTYTAIAKGELARVSDDVERLTGRPPQSLEAFLRG